MYSLILYGRRSMGFKKWCNLSISLQNSSSFVTSLSSATAAHLGPRVCRKGKNFTISYLVDSLGLAKKLAESISRKVSLVDKAAPDSVVKLLKTHGFTDSQISNIITNYPRLLIADVEKSLSPKIQFLQSRGGSISEFTEIVSSVPKILGKRGHKTISVYYDFVKDTLHCDKSSKFEKSCHSFPQGNLENKIRNVSVLRDLGMPNKLLFPLLVSVDGPVFGKEKFEESLNKVVEMGFDPTTAKFVDALCNVQGLSNITIEEKINAYKRLGLTVDDVWAVFKKWPNFLTHSEKKIENSMEMLLALGFSRDESVMLIKGFPQSIGLSTETIQKKTEFLVKKMNWPLKALASNPAVFGYSMEKRIIPRSNVIKALMSRGLIESELPSISYVFICTNKVFLNRYVKKYDDKELVTELMAIFRDVKAIQGSEA